MLNILPMLIIVRLFNQKNVLLPEIWLDYSQFVGLYINEEKNIWYDSIYAKV
jgi:hypothetical protein